LLKLVDRLPASCPFRTIILNVPKFESNFRDLRNGVREQARQWHPVERGRTRLITSNPEDPKKSPVRRTRHGGASAVDFHHSSHFQPASRLITHDFVDIGRASPPFGSGTNDALSYQRDRAGVKQIHPTESIPQRPFRPFPRISHLHKNPAEHSD